MPLVTALSMIDTASFTRDVASFDLSSTAARGFLTAVRNDAIAARLRARCLIIFRFCFSADAMLATGVISWGSEWLTRPAPVVKGRCGRPSPGASRQGTVHNALRGHSICAGGCRNVSISPGILPIAPREYPRRLWITCGPLGDGGVDLIEISFTRSRLHKKASLSSFTSFTS